MSDTKHTPEMGGTMLHLVIRDSWGDEISRSAILPQDITTDLLNAEADRQMWDYERFGATQAFLVFPVGELPLAAAIARTEGGDDV